MKKRKAAVILLISAAVLLSLSLLLSSSLRNNGAGLLVESDTPAQVYVNSELLGRTPYKTDLKPGEITIKLVPESVDSPRIAYETKVTLERGIQTVVRRVLGEQSSTSAGEVISFKKVGGSTASMAVVSTPDGAEVSIDGQVKGTAPLTIAEVTDGVHSLKVTASGYSDREFSIKATAGYRLTSIVDLAKSNESAASPIPDAPDVEGQLPEKKEESEVKQVEILSTSVGFLRVRENPTTQSLEVTRVDPGEKFDLIEDNDKGWLKIKLDDGKEGWISDEFATVSAKLST